MGTTKVILTKDLDTLGEEGDIKIVKKGYARNYLIPNGFAVAYDKKNINILERKKAIIEKKKLEKKENSNLLKQKLEAESIVIKMPAGEKGRLYGTVTTMQIAEELNKKGYNIDKKNINLAEHIKTEGKFKFTIHLYQDIYANMEVEVQAIEDKSKSSEEKTKFQKRVSRKEAKQEEKKE